MKTKCPYCGSFSETDTRGNCVACGGTKNGHIEKHSIEFFESQMLNLSFCSEDPETDHITADDILCEVLLSLGYKNLVDSFYRIKKWYA